jgi:hypothetical protein
MLTVTIGHNAGYDSRSVSARFLQQSAAATRKVIDGIGHFDGQPFVVDYVKVSLHANPDKATIMQADGASWIARVASHELLHRLPA